jgi:hypothetical protein
VPGFACVMAWRAPFRAHARTAGACPTGRSHPRVRRPDLPGQVRRARAVAADRAGELVDIVRSPLT